MHARYYSFNLGRFLSVDPVGGSVGASQSWNRYAYAANNPILLNDPTGAEIRVGNDNDRELSTLRESLDDEDLATQLKVEKKTHHFLFFKWTTNVVTNGGADWSKSANPNARLLQAAMDTSTVIDFNVTDSQSRALVEGGGAVTDPAGFSDFNHISITINPALVAQSPVPALNPANPQFKGGAIAPLGIAVMHEFGHAWGNFHDRVGGHAVAVPGEDTDWQAVEWENKARAWYYAKRPDLQPLVRPDHGNPKWWKR